MFRKIELKRLAHLSDAQVHGVIPALGVHLLCQQPVRLQHTSPDPHHSANRSQMPLLTIISCLTKRLSVALEIAVYLYRRRPPHG